MINLEHLLREAYFTKHTCSTYRDVILGLGLGGLELSDDDGDEVGAHDGRLGEPNQPRFVVDGVLNDDGAPIELPWSITPVHCVYTIR